MNSLPPDGFADENTDGPPDGFADENNNNGFDINKFSDKVSNVMRPVTNALSTAGSYAKRGLESNPLYKFSPFGAAETVMNKGVYPLFNKLGEKTAESMGSSNSPILSNPYVAGAAGTAVSMAPDIAMTFAGAEKAPMQSEYAQKRALSALGTPKRMLKGPYLSSAAKENAQVLLDKGVVGIKDAESMADDLAKLENSSGNKIGEILGKFKQKGKFFDINNAIDSVEALRPVSDSGEILRGGQYDIVNNKIDHAIETIKAHSPKQDILGASPESNISFGEANQLKGKLQDIANYASNKEATLLDKVIAGKFREALDGALEKAASEIGDSKIAEEFRKQKQNYAASQFGKDPVYNKIAAEIANKKIGLTDWILGSHSIASGNPLTALAEVGGKKLLEKYGAGMQATVANKLAKTPTLINKGAAVSNLAGKILKPKKMTEEIAAEYLDKANNDKKKAREMAKADGYEW